MHDTTDSPTALVVAAFDSQLKWAAALWTQLRDRGFQVRVVAPRSMATLSPAQISATGVDTVDVVPDDDLVALAQAHASALNVARHGEIDDVVDPAETRDLLARLVEAADRDGRLVGSGRTVDTW